MSEFGRIPNFFVSNHSPAHRRSFCLNLLQALFVLGGPSIVEEIQVTADGSNTKQRMRRGLWPRYTRSASIFFESVKSKLKIS